MIGMGISCSGSAASPRMPSGGKQASSGLSDNPNTVQPQFRQPFAARQTSPVMTISVSNRVSAPPSSDAPPIIPHVAQYSD